MTRSISSQQEQSQEFKNTNYELFIFALSILSIFNIFLDIVTPGEEVSQVIFVIDLLLSLIFLMDFLYRLTTAESKRHYFFKQWGWLDLIGSIPVPRAKIARLARIIRAVRLMRKFGLRQLLSDFAADRAGSAVYSVAFLVILVLEFGSLLVLGAEQRVEGSNIETAADAIWWSFVTMSTVGYGDFYPVSLTGRFFSIFVILIGVGLFGVVTGFLADFFTGDDEESDGTPDSTSLDGIEHKLDEIMKAQTNQAEAITSLQSKIDELEQMLKTKESE